jgi:hypothetical protein
MDPQGSRDSRMSGSDPSQWYGGPPIGSRLRVDAALFVPGMAGSSRWPTSGR